MLLRPQLLRPLHLRPGPGKRWLGRAHRKEPLTQSYRKSSGRAGGRANPLPACLGGWRLGGV